MARKFNIIYEDTHLLVLDKAAGLLSQGEETGDENLVDLLRAHFERHYVGLIHRLDRNTSGIMVVAKRSKSAQRLTDALQAGKIDRSYLAWVGGTVPAPVRWSHRLLKNAEKNLVQVLRPGDARGQEAVLSAAPRGHSALDGVVLTLLELKLETGRSHQIRAQASAEGHPLFGDRKYGGNANFPRPALHSHRIRFPHPMSPPGETQWLEFEAPLPADMAAIPVKTMPSAD